jgi:hypothetical protein
MVNRARIVIRLFSARQLYRDPPEHEAFEKGDKVVFLRFEGGDTVFVRRLEKRDAKPSFVIDQATFKQSTKRDSS